MEPVESVVTVGRIVQSRGVRGEVVVYPLSDDPARFHDFGKLLAVDKAGKSIELVVANVGTRTRQGRPEVLLVFEGIDSREASDALKGATLYVDQEDLVLDDDEYFLFDMVGLSAQTADGAPIGSVSEVRRMPAQDIFVIARDGAQDVLIPDVPEFVEKSRLDEGILIIHPIEGLLED